MNKVPCTNGFRSIQDEDNNNLEKKHGEEKSLDNDVIIETCRRSSTTRATIYTNTLFIGQSYIKRRNEENEKEEKKTRRLYDYSGGIVEREKERKREKERWRKTDAKLTSLNISYQTYGKKQKENWELI